MQNMHPSSNQALRHRQCHLPKNPVFRTHKQHPDTEERTARYKDVEEKCTIYPSANSASKPRIRNSSRSLRVLDHDDVPRFSLHRRLLRKGAAAPHVAPQEPINQGRPCRCTRLHQAGTTDQRGDASTHQLRRRRSPPSSSGHRYEGFDEHSARMSSIAHAPSHSDSQRQVHFW